MDERLVQVFGRSVESHELVNLPTLVIGCSIDPEQPELIVRRPAAVPDPSPPDNVPARDPKAHRRSRRCFAHTERCFGSKGMSRPLVRVEEDHPFAKISRSNLLQD